MDTLEQQVLQAKEDEGMLSQLIEERKNWILKCASSAVRHYVTDSDDEWSVALWAFHEAVKSYEPGKGNFLYFADLIIRRRLTDHFRSERRRENEVSVEPASFEGQVDQENGLAVDYQVRDEVAEASDQGDTAAQAREEIEAVQEILSAYGFSLFDLAECSPKAAKTRKACAQAVRIMLDTKGFMNTLRKTRALPLKELVKASGVSKKILDRHRRYIIAVAEILYGEYPLVREYLTFIREEDWP